MKIEASTITTITIALSGDEANILYKFLGEQTRSNYIEAELSEKEGDILGDLYYLLDENIPV